MGFKYLPASSRQCLYWISLLNFSRVYRSMYEYHHIHIHILHSSQLSLGDRQACRLSCRALGPAVEELLFRTISLNICNNKLEPGLSLIQSFRSDFLLSHYVKHLHIGRLEPYSTTHTPEGRYVANTTYPGAGISALLSLQNNLVPFLLSLTNLQSVE